MRTYNLYGVISRIDYGYFILHDNKRGSKYKIYHAFPNTDLLSNFMNTGKIVAVNCSTQKNGTRRVNMFLDHKRIKGRENLRTQRAKANADLAATRRDYCNKVSTKLGSYNGANPSVLRNK